MEKKPTAKMRKGVDLCERVFKVKCEGRDFESVSKFLSEYIPKLKEVDIREYTDISDKQQYAIDYIQDVLEDVTFKGANMKEASQFISEYYQKAKDIAAARSK